jgi:hypothetical protein
MYCTVRDALRSYQILRRVIDVTMSTNVTYSAAYLAESKAILLNTFYSIPIALEVISTSIRIWAKMGQKPDARMGFDDYLMIFATVHPIEIL